MRIIYICNLIKNRRSNSPGILSNCFLVLSAFTALQTNAQQLHLQVQPSVKIIDGLIAPYNSVRPGDTVYLEAGNRDKLFIRNFKGDQGNPITFLNKDGIVNISSEGNYGISINNCRFTRVSGNGSSSNFYGIQIKKVASGAGIGAGNMSSDFEIDHISIENCFTSGIFVKTDPECTSMVSRDNFTQFNTNLHDNYIGNTGNEGMYIGSSYYSGITLSCNGRDTFLLPPVLDGVQIYNNIVYHTGWDGIQVSSAPLHCRIFNNSISYDSQAETASQMSGILIGGGSACSCNNNFINDGKGDGIEDHGLGGNIFNNIIVNAGRSFLPDNLMQMKHGIFISDVSASGDSSFYIGFNDIINPKSDGIRFQSKKSTHNIIASNLIINPGNVVLYQHGNTAFSARDAYVMIPDKVSDVGLKNNYFAENLSKAQISLTDYSIIPGSPLINAGNLDIFSPAFDFANHRRPVGGINDIGAFEYYGGADTLLNTAAENAVIFPNPAGSLLKIKYLSVNNETTVTKIFTPDGKIMIQQTDKTNSPGVQELLVEVGRLSAGMYFFVVSDAQLIVSGRFVKL